LADEGLEREANGVILFGSEARRIREVIDERRNGVNVGSI
jgi:hypothetical protein